MKRKMKRKGSALVFSVLILSFFLALSLNLYFIARKKAESAGVKLKGERVTNNIDMASSLGYQELYLAENFVRLGFPYDKTTHSGAIDMYSVPESNDVYFNAFSGKYNIGEKYSGIQLNDLIDYFTANWDYEVGGDEHQKIIMSEDVGLDSFGDKVVESRMWQSGGVPEKAVPLWSVKKSAASEKKVSIGGYHLYKLNINGIEKDVSFSVNPRGDIKNNLTSDSTQDITAYYVKFITLEEDEALEIPKLNFRIEVEESFSAIGTDGDAFNDIEFYGRKISKFSIKHLEE